MGLGDIHEKKHKKQKRHDDDKERKKRKKEKKKKKQKHSPEHPGNITPGQHSNWYLKICPRITFYNLNFVFIGHE